MSAPLPILAPFLILALSLLCTQVLTACSQKVQPSQRSLPAAEHSPVAAASASAPHSSEADTTTRPTQALSQRWIVDGQEAKQLIEQGATVLDARGGFTFRSLQGAVPVNWRDFSPTEPAARGTLLASDEQLTEQLQALGIRQQLPVVVFGQPPSGWGEEGRIVWMLRSLGHTQAVMVDGGIQALFDADVTIPQADKKERGDFIVQRDSAWDIQQQDLRRQLGADNLVVIDTREPREFSGETPYGEQRGGHIPGASHLYFKELLDTEGNLLPQQDLFSKLEALSITPESQVVVYCTGGIRSGWLVAVLVSLGYQAQNYAGSMWEWSAAPAADYPLKTAAGR
ncbi:MAG: rhodanese-like domain-containing protein [Cyanobacteria bacterium J06606_4]